MFRQLTKQQILSITFITIVALLVLFKPISPNSNIEIVTEAISPTISNNVIIGQNEGDSDETVQNMQFLELSLFDEEAKKMIEHNLSNEMQSTLLENNSPIKCVDVANNEDWQVELGIVDAVNYFRELYEVPNSKELYSVNFCQTDSSTKFLYVYIYGCAAGGCSSGYVYKISSEDGSLGPEIPLNEGQQGPYTGCSLIGYYLPNNILFKCGAGDVINTFAGLLTVDLINNESKYLHYCKIKDYKNIDPNNPEYICETVS